MTDQATGSTAPPAPQGDNAAPAVPAPGTTATPSTGEQPATNGTQTGTPAEPTRPKVDGRVRRINELTYDKRELQRQNERLASSLEAALKDRGKSGDTKPPPKLQDFKTLDEFLSARDEYLLEKMQGTSGERRTDQSSGQTQVDPQVVERYNAENDSFIDEGVEKYGDDFSDMIRSDELKITPPMRQFMLESDVGVDVAHHLAMHPDEARKISKLSPMRQVAALGKLEDKLEAAPKGRTRQAAPPPVNPVSGAATAGSPNVESMKDFTKARRSGVKLNDLLRS